MSWVLLMTGAEHVDRDVIQQGLNSSVYSDYGVNLDDFPLLIGGTEDQI